MHYITVYLTICKKFTYQLTMTKTRFTFQTLLLTSIYTNTNSYRDNDIRQDLPTAV